MTRTPDSPEFIEPVGRLRVLGILSDTHGRLYDDVVRALEGVDAILHAGDVGSPDVLERLAALAPVKAVRGNTDTHQWARALPRDLVLDMGSTCIVLSHRREDALAALRDILSLPRENRVPIVVSGHTHRAEAVWREGVLYLNPGAAGPARFDLGRSCALLKLEEGRVVPEVRHLG